MDQIMSGVVPPPLPPKTRRSPPTTTTTSSSSAAATAENATTVLASSTGTATGDEYSLYGTYTSTEDNSQRNVVKIRINPEHRAKKAPLTSVICEVTPCIRISVNSNNSSGSEMVHHSNLVGSAVSENGIRDRSSGVNNGGYFFYNTFNCAVMSSGQVSPSDTLDSGTCSDLDGTPPPLPKKKSAGVSITHIGGLQQHKRASSLTDSDDNESNISCDSLNCGKISPVNGTIITSQNQQDVVCKTEKGNSLLMRQNLLQDIRDRKIVKPSATESNNVTVKSYEERKEEEKVNICKSSSLDYETDMFYDFHLNEHLSEDKVEIPKTVVDDESFAGYKDLLGEGASTIRSAKGTVRGVKNRVRAGIATFLQINTVGKSYKEKDANKVVVYTTTMGILRDTYQACMKVKQIMRTLLIKFEERDVFMSTEYQSEIRERMRCDHILVPQVFVDGQHVGDAETIERLNETGELRRILKPYKSMDACTPCKVCGGYRLLPCQVCNGSKKSVHRNHFTAEFVALKCMNCDEVGLVKCSAC